MAARAKWGAALRHILSTNRRNLNTASEVIEAIEAGLYPEAEPPLAAWLDIAPTYTHDEVIEWVDDCAVQAVERWAQKNEHGIIWCKRLPFARAVAAALDVPCFGEKGRDEYGDLIPQMDTDPDGCGRGVVVSTLANITGMNLQGWHRALVVSPPSGGMTWEQMIGRLHRTGQTADVVQFDVFLATEEQRACLYKARESARYIESTTGQQQRLLIADDLTQER
jgi:hypothetical protein